jgi:hypothetical protein
MRETPFYLNYSYPPIGSARHEIANNPHAKDHVQYLLKLRGAQKNTISDAQQAQQKYANQHCIESAIY